MKVLKTLVLIISLCVELCEWRKAFDNYDHDSDDVLSVADFQKDPNLSLEKLQLFKAADLDLNNVIDFGEFVAVAVELDVLDLKQFFEGFSTVDIQLEFEKFAVSSQGRKLELGVKELQHLMRRCDCICVTETDAAALLFRIGKGATVDFDCFKTWVTARRP